MISIWHSLDKFICAGKLTGPFTLFLCSLFISPAKVFQYCSGKKYILLKYNRNLVTKHFHIIIPHIDPAHFHASFAYIIKAADQIHQTGFGASSTSDNTDGFPCVNGQINIFQYVFFSFFLIAERNMVKVNPSIRNFNYRLCRIGQICFLINNFCHTLCTGHTHSHHNKYHRQHHQTHQDIHTISKKAHQFAGGKTAANDHFCPKPADTKNTGVYSKLHQRHIHNNQLFCPYKHFVYFIAGLLKFTGFIILTHISFYHANSGYILLYACIQVIIFLKNLLKIPGSPSKDHNQCKTKKNNCNQIYTCKSGIDQEGHSHGTDQTGWCPGTHTKKHLVCILKVGHICCQTGDQTCCAEFVNI